MGENENTMQTEQAATRQKMKTSEFISQYYKPENKWQFLQAFCKTRQFLWLLIGVFALLFIIILMAFIVILKNPEIIQINIK